MSNVQLVREAAQKCLEQAGKKYGLDLSHVHIRFDLKGAAAGMAGYKGKTFYLRFNTTMIQHEGLDHILNETVPHEVAHIVCFVNPRLGSNHDNGWKRVCIDLGGSGKRCHSEQVIYAKGKTYEYTCTQGTTISMSEQRHRKIQQGASYTLKKGGSINRDCEHRVIGISGRPVAALNKQAARQTSNQTETNGANTMTDVNTSVEATVTETTTPKATKQTKQKQAKAPTKADSVRAIIAECKLSQADVSNAIERAIAELGMKKQLARTYVNNNWDKVEVDQDVQDTAQEPAAQAETVQDPAQESQAVEGQSKRRWVQRPPIFPFICQIPVDATGRRPYNVYIH